MTAIAILLAALLLPVRSDWTVSPLRPDGDPGVLLCDDLDGDGDQDLLMIAGRQATTFFFREGGYPQEPDRSFTIPDDVVFVEVGELDGDQARELLLLTPSGVLAQRFSSGKPESPERVEQLACDDIFLFEVPDEDVGWNDVLMDLDGEGGEDALLPTRSGYRIFFRTDDPREFSPGGIVPILPTGSFSLSVGSDLGTVEQTVEMPRIFCGDLDGDGRKEILTFDGRAVRAYARPEEADATWSLLLERVLYDSDKTLPEEYLSSRNVRIENLDGGDSACMMVVRSMEGEVDFFGSGSKGLLGTRSTLRLEGWVLPPKLIDLDGDNRLDMLAPTIEAVGSIRLMKIFLSQSVKMRYSIFRNRERVRYARTPDEVRQISFPLEYETGAGGVRVENQMIYSFDADFDGDGLKDFLVKSSPEELSIYYGQPNATFSREVSDRIRIPRTTPYLSVAVRTWDLDHDGRSEILLHYEGRSGQPHLYRLLSH